MSNRTWHGWEESTNIAQSTGQRHGIERPRKGVVNLQENIPVNT